MLVLVVTTGCGTIITPQPSPTPTPAAESAGSTYVTPTPNASEPFLTPIPPTPTFTPSPSPTPVIHIVESGDTLFGIALEYGVTTEALQAVNDIQNPNALRIGQSLIIPLRTPEAEEVSQIPVDNLLLPTPTPLPVEVRGVGRYPTAVGGTWCMGEVVNTTSGPITNLQVRVTLVDGQGMPLVSALTLAAADYLTPGASAPFTVLFDDSPQAATDVRVTLLRAESVGAITAGFVPLATAETEGAVSGPQYRVTGRLINDAGVAVQRITVVVTLYDEEGRVNAYRQAVLGEQTLSAGASGEFSLLLTPHGRATPASFRVLAWGSRAG